MERGFWAAVTVAEEGCEVAFDAKAKQGITATKNANKIAASPRRKDIFRFTRFSTLKTTRVSSFYIVGQRKVLPL
jgi:hypothetical protein